MKKLIEKILPRNLALMKSQMASRLIRRKLTPLTIIMCAVALLTSVSVTFAWFGSTFENLNTTITMGEYSAAISVYDSNGNIVENKIAENGDTVSFSNTHKMNGWACGSTSAYYIYTDNTGEIDIKTYLSFASSFSATDGTEYDENRKHFAFFVKDITKEVETANGLSTYINSKKIPVAEVIRNGGSTFADKDSVFAGKTESGKSSVYALYFCCYDLPNKFIDSKYSFDFSTKIATTQADAPDTESFVAGPELVEIPTNTIKLPMTETEEPTTVVVNKTEPTQPSANIEKSEDTFASRNNEWVWKYNDSDRKTATMLEYNGTAKEVVIPAIADKSVVTSLGDNMFKNSKVKKVTVPASVKSFKADTFTCNSLKTLEFQSKTMVSKKEYKSEFYCDNKAVYSADKSALIRCLPQSCGKDFVVPTEVKIIYDYAFKGCAVETVSVKNVASLGADTFAKSKIKCLNLYNNEPVVCNADSVFGKNMVVHILSSMKDAYKDSTIFDGCTVKYDLKTDIYENYPYVEINGLHYEILKNNDTYNGVKYSDDYSDFVIITDCKKMSKDNTVVVPGTIVCDNRVYNVVAIADGAFSKCKDLKTIVLPSHKIEYTSKAFEKCEKLELIQYGDVLTTDKADDTARKDVDSKGSK